MRLLTLPSCIDIATQLQPVNMDVKPAIEASTCRPIILGLGFGTNRWADAINNGRSAIHRIHSVELRQTLVLGFGAHCLEIRGE
jgi:hypothetical protein